jgi:hypothetical protein
MGFQGNDTFFDDLKKEVTFKEQKLEFYDLKTNPVCKDKKKNLDERKLKLEKLQKEKLAKSYYDLVDPKCKANIIKYDSREHIISELGCNNWSCARCRPVIKKNLFFGIIKASSVFGLDKHIIVTPKGKEYRQNHTIRQAFIEFGKDMYNWHKVINYNEGKMEYIQLSRSQSDGYQHYHILADKYIPKKDLKKYCSKYKSLGYSSIQQNNDVAKYLSNDFWKDHETVIPDRVKHYTSSKDVAPYLTQNFDKSEDTVILKLNRNFDTFSQIDNLVISKSGYPVPLDAMLKYLEPSNKVKICIEQK